MLTRTVGAPAGARWPAAAKASGNQRSNSSGDRDVGRRPIPVLHRTFMTILRRTMTTWAASRLPVAGRSAVARVLGLVRWACCATFAAGAARAQVERSRDAADARAADHRRRARRRRRRHGRGAEPGRAGPAPGGQPGAGRLRRHRRQRRGGAYAARRGPLLGRADLRPAARSASALTGVTGTSTVRHRRPHHAAPRLRAAPRSLRRRSASPGRTSGSGRFAGTDTFDFGLSLRAGRHVALGVTRGRRVAAGWRRRGSGTRSWRCARSAPTGSSWRSARRTPTPMTGANRAARPPLGDAGRRPSPLRRGRDVSRPATRRRSRAAPTAGWASGWRWTSGVRAARSASTEPSPARATTAAASPRACTSRASAGPSWSARRTSCACARRHRRRSPRSCSSCAELRSLAADRPVAGRAVQDREHSTSAPRASRSCAT